MPITFQIVEMRKNPFDKEHASTHMDAHYSWSLQCVGSSWTTNSSMVYKEIVWLLPYFKVNTPQELIGKTFEVPAEYDDASTAINYLLTVIKNGGSYAPPSQKELVLRAVNALGRLQIPDFEGVDSLSIHSAFVEMFPGFGLDDKWFETLKEAILEASKNEVSLEKADINEFPYRVRGPGEYLKLVKGSQTKLLFFGPYSTPFSFGS